MSKYCKNCGSPLKAEVKFCGSCGTAVPAPNRQGTAQAAPTAQNSAQALAAEKAKRSDDRNTGRLKKLLIPGMAFLTIVIALVIAVPRLFDLSQNSAGIKASQTLKVSQASLMLARPSPSAERALAITIRKIAG